MAVVEYSGALYTSSDHYSWNSPSSMSDDGTVTHDWQAIAMSADGGTSGGRDGTIVSTVAANGQLMNGEGGVYLSTDSGANWNSVVFGGSASLNLVDASAVAGSGTTEQHTTTTPTTPSPTAARAARGVWISADAGWPTSGDDARLRRHRSEHLPHQRRRRRRSVPSRGRLLHQRRRRRSSDDYYTNDGADVRQRPPLRHSPSQLLDVLRGLAIVDPPGCGPKGTSI